MEKKIDTELLRQYMMGGASPKIKPKFTLVEDVVDLHLRDEELSKSIKNSSPIEIQIAQFEKAIDAALAQKKWEIRIIHGNGSGKLKQALHQFLTKHPYVKSFENGYHSQYGWGSTVVYFN